MNLDELLEKFPEIVFGSIRQQMLLGAVPAKTVSSILEPFLANFWDVMPQLSPDLQADFENILRIYSDVAANFGLRMKSPIGKALPLLAQYLHKREGPQPVGDADELDLAAEGQEKLEAPTREVLFEGQGFFRSDKGNSVYFEFSFAEGEDFITFGCKPVEMGVDILIGGESALAVPPGEPEKRVGIEEFQEMTKDWILPEININIVERREGCLQEDV